MAARLALERVAGHGFLMRDMVGRAVLYRLSDWALSHHQERFARLLGTDTQPEPWDGQWTLVLAWCPRPSASCGPSCARGCWRRVLRVL